MSAQVSKNALDVWGLDKESALHKFFVGEPMGVVASSPDGAFFAAGSLTGAAYLWEVSTGKLVRTWPAHFKAVSAIAFNSDGSVLVTGGDDTVVSVWCLAALLDPASTSSASVNPTHSWAEHSLPVASICGDSSRRKKPRGGLGHERRRAQISRVSPVETRARRGTTRARRDRHERDRYPIARDGTTLG